MFLERGFGTFFLNIWISYPKRSFSAMLHTQLRRLILIRIPGFSEQAIEKCKGIVRHIIEIISINEKQ